MRAGLLIILLCTYSTPSLSQNRLRLTDLATQKTVDVNRQQFIQCRYKIRGGYELLTQGVVNTITDSTIIYKTTWFSGKQQIPISAITNIDRVPLKRSFVPAVVLALLAVGIDRTINPQRSESTRGLLAAGAGFLGASYVLRWNHRHLNRNRIGETTSVSVLPID